MTHTQSPVWLRASALLVVAVLSTSACGGDSEDEDVDVTVDAGDDAERDARDAADSEGDRGADTVGDVLEDGEGDVSGDLGGPDSVEDTTVADADADAADSGAGDAADAADAGDSGLGDAGEVGDAGAPDHDLEDEPDAVLYDLEIAPFAASPIFLTTNATIGAGEIVLPLASGGEPPYRYSAGPLPTGVLFSETQRALRGTPTVAGSTTMVYRAVDARGATGEASVEIVVGADVIGPNPPTDLSFVDDESGATGLRPADFGFAWTQSTSSDTARQLIYLYPAGADRSGGEPIADLGAGANSFTLSELLDSHGDCLEESTAYEAQWVLFDRTGNRAPAEDASPAELAQFELSFTSDGPDFTNRLTNSRFDSGIAGWSSRAEADGGTPSVSTAWDSTRDAGQCGESGSIRVTNDSVAGEDVRGGVDAIVYVCIPVTGTRTYGLSADVYIPPGQPRDGVAFMSATWYPEDDCSGIPEGNSTTPTLSTTDGWEFAYFDGTRIPRVAVSAEVRLVVAKAAPSGGQADDGVFEAWFDNVVFGRNE